MPHGKNPTSHAHLACVTTPTHIDRVEQLEGAAELGKCILLIARACASKQME